MRCSGRVSLFKPVPSQLFVKHKGGIELTAQKLNIPSEGRPRHFQSGLKLLPCNESPVSQQVVELIDSVCFSHFEQSMIIGAHSLSMTMRILHVMYRRNSSFVIGVICDD